MWVGDPISRLDSIADLPNVFYLSNVASVVNSKQPWTYLFTPEAENPHTLLFAPQVDSGTSACTLAVPCPFFLILLPPPSLEACVPSPQLLQQLLHASFPSDFSSLESNLFMAPKYPETELQSDSPSKALHARGFSNHLCLTCKLSTLLHQAVF